MLGNKTFPKLVTLGQFFELWQIWWCYSQTYLGLYTLNIKILDNCNETVIEAEVQVYHCLYMLSLYLASSWGKHSLDHIGSVEHHSYFHISVVYIKYVQLSLANIPTIYIYVILLSIIEKMEMKMFRNTKRISEDRWSKKTL